MKTNKEGGCFTRIMPPLDYDHGPIPISCYDKNLSRREIESMLLEVYLDPKRVADLAESEDPIELFVTRCAIEIVAETDANTIYWYNQYKDM